jgi:hypothetical protein
MTESEIGQAINELTLTSTTGIYNSQELFKTWNTELGQQLDISYRFVDKLPDYYKTDE